MGSWQKTKAFIYRWWIFSEVVKRCLKVGACATRLSSKVTKLWDNLQSNPHQRQSSYNWLILFISGSVPLKIRLGEEEGLALIETILLVWQTSPLNSPFRCILPWNATDKWQNLLSCKGNLQRNADKAPPIQFALPLPLLWLIFPPPCLFGISWLLLLFVEECHYISCLCPLITLLTVIIIREHFSFIT